MPMRKANTYRGNLRPMMRGIGKLRRAQRQRIAAHFHLTYIPPKGDGHETHYGRRRSILA